jgi:hypothetical protein
MLRELTSTVNRFRTRRGQRLRRQIEVLADHLGRDIVVLDVGGRPAYWANVGLAHIARIEVLNSSETELEFGLEDGGATDIFVPKVGDARNLSDYADGSVDLVHSNSVIEHVGGWTDMRAMADEMMRVGRAGWMQTPAWEFPVEPHFRAPFLHWFGEPLRARMLSLSVEELHRGMDRHKRRTRVEMIHLLSKGDVRALFPEKTIEVERFALWPKSYMVRWMPDGLPLASTTHSQRMHQADAA